MQVKDGYARMEALLGLARPPEALVAVNLLVHLGMERRLLEARPFPGGRPAGGPPRKCLFQNMFGRPQGYRPAIAAFDETAYSPFLPACRYAAAQDAAAMGREAAQRILERIARKRNAGTEDGSSGEKSVVRLPVRIVHKGFKPL
jgi:LacI family transcriptional regulator